MAEKRWKAVERAIGARLGGVRVPVTGRARGSAPDVETPWLSVEVKSRKALPVWIKEALDQARCAARPMQCPIAVLHEIGDRHTQDVVILRLGDWIEWFGEVSPDG